MAEQGTGQHVAGIAEVWVVKDVEELGSKTKHHLLGEVKLPLHRKIQVRCSDTAQHIASEIAVLPNGRHGEGRLIEDFSAGILSAKKFERRSRYDVRAGIERRACGKIYCTN